MEGAEAAPSQGAPVKVSTIEVDGQTLKLYDSSDGHAKVGADSPHAHYAIARGDVHADASAFKFLASKVGPIGSVIELFGGSGWHTSIIQRLNCPVAHHVFEIDGDCVRSIRESLPGVHVVQGDSYVDGLAQLKVAAYDWVHADFNNLTFMRWADALKPVGKLVHGIFESATQWVTLTDSALFGLARFPQNRTAYANAFGIEKERGFKPRDYYEEVGKRIANAWGFRLQHVVTWHSMAAMMLFRKTEDARPFAFTEHKDKIRVYVKSVETVE